MSKSPTTSVFDSSPVSSSSAEPSTTTLPGREVDIGPAIGASLAVVGVEYDDVLNVRAEPGVGGPVLLAAAPTETNVIAQGRTRVMPDGDLWTEVEVVQVVGWVHMGYVAAVAGTDDVTAQVVGHLGEYPTTTSMHEMGYLIASVFASSEPASRIVMVADTTPGGMQDVTFDVIGVGDDAIRGYRIRVFAVVVSDGLSFHSAELTTLCARGVTVDGLCV